MEWTNEDRLALLSFRDLIDSDDIKIKKEIKNRLLNNKFIVHVIHNEELERVDAEPEDYFGLNIKPYYFIPDTQTDAQTYVCFTTSYDEVGRYNNTTKYMQITFTILCHKGMVDDLETSLPRHDLLAALILDEFNWLPMPGGRIKCISNKETITDTNYLVRTLIFQQTTDNNIVKTKNGTTEIINKKMVY